MEQALKEKFEVIVGLVDNHMADLDIDIDYCIPEVITTSDRCDVSGDPYILVKYCEDDRCERKIRLSEKYIKMEAKDLANFVSFAIEQFKEEVESLKYGAQ